MEEISQLGQVTYSPCSVSEQKGLHFPNQPLLGTPLRSARTVLSLTALWPLVPTLQLFSREHCLSCALWAADQIYYRTGWTLSSLVRVCFSLALVCMHFLCAHLCGRKAERARDRQTRPEMFRERERERE